jgi:sec-independent protein translocase protein TatC
MTASETPDLADSGHMSLMDHLAELRRRIIISIVAIAIGATIAWTFYDPIFEFLVDPYCTALEDNGQALVTTGSVEGDSGCGAPLLVTDPLEGFATRLKVSGYVGIALAMPIILFQLWRFIAPGLYAKERRYALPFVVSALFLFFLGAGLAYWTLPRALGFLIDIGGSNLLTAYSPNRYLSLITYMMLAFGIGFEFPILLVFLQLAGILEPDTLRRSRRYAWVGIFVLVAVITPSGDPISLFALALPMGFFYEVSILIGSLHQRRRRKAELTGT